MNQIAKSFWKTQEKLGNFFMRRNVDETQLRAQATEGEQLEAMIKTGGWSIVRQITSDKVQTCIDALSLSSENAISLSGKIKAYRELEEEITIRIRRGRHAVETLEKNANLKRKEKANARAR